MAQTVGTSQATPDADLIAACADYLRIQRAWSAYCESLDGDVEKNDPNVSMLDPLATVAEKIVALTATTAEGHAARARCMAFWYLPSHRIAQDDPDGDRAGCPTTRSQCRAALGNLGGSNFAVSAVWRSGPFLEQICFNRWSYAPARSCRR